MMNREKRTQQKQVILVILAVSLLIISGCSVRYTNFSYQIRGCIESDKDDLDASGSTIRITRIANLSDIRFEKEENTIKMYYRTQSPCKRYDIAIMNLTEGKYTVETYDIKYEEISFFELTNTTQVILN